MSTCRQEDAEAPAGRRFKAVRFAREDDLLLGETVLARGEGCARNFAPSGLAELRKTGVALEVGVDLGQVNAPGKRQCLAVNFPAADDKGLCRSSACGDGCL